MLFHSPLGVLFTFPSRYWFAIGRRRVFSLGGWSPRLRAGFLVAGPTREGECEAGRASPTGLSPCAAGHRPLSLAATRGISVDFSSSGYLDVSVPRVASSPPIAFRGGWRGMTPAGFPHSGTWGSKAVCASPQTIAACRALLRLPAPRHPPRAHAIFAFRLLESWFPKMYKCDGSHIACCIAIADANLARGARAPLQDSYLDSLWRTAWKTRSSTRS